MEKVYANPLTHQFLSLFSDDPKTLDPLRYEKLVQEANGDMRILLQRIESEYQLVVAPAFSDWVNDPQPVWSDVTYLRLYLDFTPIAQKYIHPEQKPYILFDGAKASLYPCKVPNEKLWETLSDLVVHYQDLLGIDGVRIDMGHALPQALVQRIIAKDPNVCFIAEELDIQNAEHIKAQGFNLFNGNGFSGGVRIQEGQAKTFYTTVPTLALPLFAYSESHDTCRTSARVGKKKMNDLCTTINMFLPNTVFFINSGQELYEIQLMNLGLDCNEDQINNLEPSDPRYRKLALFDPFYFTYNDFDDTLFTRIQYLQNYRQTYIDSIKNKWYLDLAIIDDSKTKLAFALEREDTYLLLVANLDLFNKQSITVDTTPLHYKGINIVLSNDKDQDMLLPTLQLDAGEVILLELNKT
ncbi:hypothetical protein A4S06_00450 [Erysipelotrichaceae bacterium MTC7]|nr:hypothetical protein A4S06_00450 [Erysipelotrichaceae bacterium MTC7]